MWNGIRFVNFACPTLVLYDFAAWCDIFVDVIRDVFQFVPLAVGKFVISNSQISI